MSESASVYGVITSWLTPSCLFVFINLVIGTIVITSRFANTINKQQHHQLVRSPSLLTRLTSFNFSYHKHRPTTTPRSVVVDPIQSQDSTWLHQVPSSSLLDQVKSFDHSLDEAKIEGPNPVEQRLNSVQLNLDQVPSLSLLDRVRSFNLSFYKAETEGSNSVQQNLDQVPSLSLLDRVRSLNLSFNKAEIDGEDSVQQLNRTPSILERIKSLTFNRSESVKEFESEGEAMSGGELMEGREEEEGVDAKADDFINRFRQQLRLQRLDSVIRYRDMLKRN